MGVKKQRGFSHLEVLLSMSLFLISITYLLSLQSQLFTYSKIEEEREKMILEATNFLEELKSGENPQQLISESPYKIKFEDKDVSPIKKEVTITIIHPKNQKYDITFKHYILKQEVKTYDEKKTTME